MDIYDLLQDVRFAQQIERVKTSLLQRGHHEWKGRRELQQRVLELEGGLGVLALLVRGLTELCVEKGVIEHGELMRRLARLDLADGRADRKLDPKLALPARPARPSRTVRPKSRRKAARR